MKVIFVSNFDIRTNEVKVHMRYFGKYAGETQNYRNEVDVILKNVFQSNSFGMSARTYQLTTDLDQRVFETKLLETQLEKVVQRYQDAEKKNCGYEYKNAENKPDNDYIYDGGKQILNIIKGLMKWGKELTDNEGNKNQYGFLSGLIGYLVNLYDFNKADKNGTDGWKKWLKLVDSSTGLWEKLYDFADAKYELNWKGVPIISAIGDVSSLIASIVDLSDNEYNTAFGWIGGILGLGNDATDVVTGIIGGGTYSGAGLWGVFAKTLFTYYSQMALSADEYLVDGEWDLLGDTPAMFCDAGVCALYEMIDGLTLGLISENTTGTSGVEISRDLQEFAKSDGRYIRFMLDGKADLACDEGVYSLYKLIEALSLGTVSEETTGVTAYEISTNFKNWAREVIQGMR